jgi:Trk-type K+ transport system membrane component
MSDAVRVTWAGVFLTLGGAMGFGCVVRWLAWKDDGGYGAHPQVLWTMGFMALGLLLAAAQLFLPAFRREREAQRAESALRAAQGNDWVDK